MSDPNPPTLFRKKRVRPYVGRGEVYSWLRAYHSQIVTVLARAERSWAELAAEMGRAGLVGRDGATPRANSALKVWRRVCRDVAAEAKAAAAAPKRKFPSRISPDWRPLVVPPPPIPPTPPQARLPAPVPGEAGQAKKDDIEMTPEGQARLDDALEMLRQTDLENFKLR